MNLWNSDKCENSIQTVCNTVSSFFLYWIGLKTKRYLKTLEKHPTAQLTWLLSRCSGHSSRTWICRLPKWSRFGPKCVHEEETQLNKPLCHMVPTKNTAQATVWYLNTNVQLILLQRLHVYVCLITRVKIQYMPSFLSVLTCFWLCLVSCNQFCNVLAEHPAGTWTPAVAGHPWSS